MFSPSDEGRAQALPSSLIDVGAKDAIHVGSETKHSSGLSNAHLHMLTYTCSPAHPPRSLKEESRQ